MFFSERCGTQHGLYAARTNIVSDGGRISKVVVTRATQAVKNNLKGFRMNSSEVVPA
jgi:hypothetical protein